MRSLREIVFKTLTDEMGVDPSLLSRIEGDKPVKISLTGGESVYLSTSHPDNKGDGDESIQMVLEIPVNKEQFINSCASFGPHMITDIELFLSYEQDKALMMTSVSSDRSDVKKIEQKIIDVMVLFNQILEGIEDVKSRKTYQQPGAISPALGRRSSPGFINKKSPVTKR